LLQERIIKDEVYFTDSGFSAFCNRMVAVIFAIVMVGVKDVNVSVNVNVTVQAAWRIRELPVAPCECMAQGIFCLTTRSSWWLKVFKVFLGD